MALEGRKITVLVSLNATAEFKHTPFQRDGFIERSHLKCEKGTCKTELVNKSMLFPVLYSEEIFTETKMLFGNR